MKTKQRPDTRKGTYAEMRTILKELRGIGCVITYDKILKYACARVDGNTVFSAIQLEKGRPWRFFFHNGMGIRWTS